MPNQTAELLPCPFCGCSARITRGRLARSTFADCPGCGATGPEFFVRDRSMTNAEIVARAAEGWNRRANVGRLHAASDALGEMQMECMAAAARADACKAVKP